MDRRERIEDEERGQVMVLFALMFIGIVLFVALTVDVGMYFMTRQNAQNVADAAGLAGAQELPDDPIRAEVVARDYVTRNGLDPADFDFTFYCTSTYVQSCDPANGKYDTMRVETVQTAPAFFGPIVALVNSGSCWAQGCDTDVHAAACRGSCGASGAEVDVVLTIDHTGSMSASDLANAKDGARSFMRSFDYQIHRLGLAVTPPVDPTNHCDTINNWTDPKVWLPVPLTNNYQTVPGTLNTSSALVSTVGCLDIPSGELSGPHTNLGEPLKAAMAELQANGRPGAKLGIVLETDGAANIMDTAAAAAIGATGPCDYAVKVAAQIKAAGIEIYTIAYGADDRCTQDPAGTYWRNRSAVELLHAIATDDEHAYYEPRAGDLDAIFAEVGQQLAGGSKLVE